MSGDYLDIVDHLLGGGRTWQQDFWVRPVSIAEFCQSPEHLKNVQLSARQLKAFEEFLGDDPVMIFDKRSTRANLCCLAWGKGCLLGTTPLTLADGTRTTLADLAQGTDEFIKIGSYNLETRGLTVMDSSPPFWRGSGECVRVRTATGRVVECFVEHQFLVAPRNNRERNRPAQTPVAWTPIKELGIGDFIALPAYIPATGTKHAPEEARYIGYVLGDGSASTSDTTPKLKCENLPEVVDDIRTTIAAVTGRLPTEWPDRNCTWFGSGFDPWETRRGENAGYQLAQQMGLLGKVAATKRIPDECFQYDDDSVWELLSGLWMTDGWVSRMQTDVLRGGSTWEAGYGSVSEELVRGIAELLQRYGIVARVGRKTQLYDGKPYVSWTVKLRERAMLAAFLRRIRLVGPKAEKTVAALEEIGHLPRAGRGMHLTVKNDLYWDRIVEVTPIGVHDYYDLEVEETENYIAGGVVHHNSGKNMMATIIQQYLFYVLLCMRDPLTYFGFPSGESIDMLNVAASANQAQKNFFSKFMRRIKTWKWLKEHFEILQHGRPLAKPAKSRGVIRITDDSVQWDGGVQCVSAHSDSKGYEGYSVLFFVMDEASSWETEYVTGENGEQIAVSRAHSIFDTLRTSAISRSWKWGGMIISYPRNEDDFTLDMAMAIQRGDIKDAYADIAATWEVKPLHLWVNQETFEHKVIRPWGMFSIFPPKDFEEEFKNHPQQSELKYACVPSRTNSYFIYQNGKIHECAAEVPPLVTLRPIDFVTSMEHGDKAALSYTGWDILSYNRPHLDPHIGNYYSHLDLSVSSDITTMAIGHAEPWEATVMIQDDEGGTITPLTHKVVIDQIIMWVPDARHLVSTVNVDDIVGRLDDVLRFRYISLDQYESAAILERAARKGKEAGKHNVKNAEYLLLRSLIHANAIVYPKLPQLLTELEKLVWDGRRVDHLPHYSKDIADAIAGVARSIFLKRGKRRQQVKYAFS